MCYRCEYVCSPYLQQVQEKGPGQVTVFEVSQQLHQILQPPLLPWKLLIQGIILITGRQEQRSEAHYSNSQRQFQDISKALLHCASCFCLDNLVLTAQHTVKRVLFSKDHWWGHDSHLQLSLEQNLAPPSLPGLKVRSAATSFFCPCKPESCLSTDGASHILVWLRYHSKMSRQGAL